MLSALTDARTVLAIVVDQGFCVECLEILGERECAGGVSTQDPDH